MITRTKICICTANIPITVRCETCSQVISQHPPNQDSIIGLIVVDAGMTTHYLLGEKAIIQCCGKDRLIPKIFKNSADVDTEAAQLNDHLQQTRSIEGLALIEVPTTFRFN